MSFVFEDLDDQTRACMLEELEFDIQNGSLYKSERFNERGIQLWPGLLREAIMHHDEKWLAQRLREEGCFNQMEPRIRSGKQTWAKVPSNAADGLAEGEFNRLYARGLCTRAIKEMATHVEVYRGKAVANPRPESEAKIGQVLAVEILLQDLRKHVGVDTALGVPAGPNSGITVRLLRR